ncbi:MAG: hypothetical protein IT377_00945 [Polyangiaceae bacterium]|nr:hypothetical protein [Polyangiaceae bacterium]
MRSSCAAGALAVVLSAWPAVAQDTSAVAESLFREGKRLFEAGRLAEACPKLEESLRLDPESGGAQLLAATCLEKTGKLARAWSAYLSARRLARASGRDDRLSLAEAGAKRVEARVPSIVIHVAPEAMVEGLRVKLNGVEIGRGGWGTPTPVDPGNVVIAAIAPGYAAWSTQVTASAGGGTRDVKVPALVPEASAGSPAAAGAASMPAATEAATHPSRDPATRDSSGSRAPDGGSAPVGGYVIGGLGLVSLGVGAYYGVSSMEKQSDADSLCPSDECTNPDGVSLAKDAKSQRTVAWVFLGAGAAAVTVGAVWIATAGGRRDGSARASFGVAVGPAGGAGVVRGVF